MTRSGRLDMVGQQGVQHVSAGVMIIACLGLLTLGVTRVPAQTPTTLPATATSTQPSLPGITTQDLQVNIEELEGIRPNMSMAEVLQTAIERVESGRFEQGRRILLYLIGQARTNYYAISNYGFSLEREADRIRADRSDPEANSRADALIERAILWYEDAARLAVEVQDWRVAEQIYSRILALRPTHPGALLGQARVLANTNRRIQAISQYRAYLESPAGRSDARAHLEIGRLYLQGEHWRQAIDALFRAQALAADDPDIDLALAEAYRRGNQLNDALAASRAAAQKAPNQPPYHRLYAELLLDNGNVEEAARVAQRAVELGRSSAAEDPTAPLRIRELGLCYDVLERAVNRLLEAQPGDVNLRLRFAEVIAERGEVGRIYDLSRAISVLNEAARGDRPDVRVLTEIARLNLRLDRQVEARRAAEQILAVDPDNTTARQILEQIRTVAPGGSAME